MIHPLPIVADHAKQDIDTSAIRLLSLDQRTIGSVLSASLGSGPDSVLHYYHDLAAR